MISFVYVMEMGNVVNVICNDLWLLVQAIMNDINDIVNDISDIVNGINDITILVTL